MDMQKLKEKYGETKVMVIPTEDIYEHLNLKNIKNKFSYELEESNLNALFEERQYIYRYIAEIDENFKQPIPYIIFYNPSIQKYFVMERIDGDERLVGKKSLGVGGHIDENELFESALYREITEEIGLSRNDVQNLEYKGIIYDDSNDVGKVHIGFLYLANVDKMEIVCLEKDKLKGYYLSKEEISKNLNNFETWSQIAFNAILNEV